jgi:hypothetical protein
MTPLENGIRRFILVYFHLIFELKMGLWCHHLVPKFNETQPVVAQML